MLASLRGATVRGPMVGDEHAYVLARDWLGPSEHIDRDRALSELGRRYLAGHGPADERDLARWSGLPLGEVRRGLAAIAPELRQGADGLLDLRKRPRAAPLPPPRLLGAFDPLLLGWSSRTPVLGGNESVVTSNGIFRPFALVGGRAAATWSLNGGKIALKPFTALSTDEEAALQVEAEQVLRFLGRRSGAA